MEVKKPLSQETINTFVASAHGKFDELKEILATHITLHPEILDARSDDDETALQAASHTGQKVIAEYLLEAGASLDICAAAFLGKFDETKAMLEENKDLVTSKGSHNIPLMFYVGMGGNIEIARLLKDTGADLNSGDGVITGLHGAIFSNNKEILEWMIANGASPQLKDHSGKTPLDLAVIMKKEELEQILKNRV